MTREAETATKFAAIVIALAAAAIIAVTVPAAFAGSAGGSQLACYDHVIGTCSVSNGDTSGPAQILQRNEMAPSDSFSGINRLPRCSS